MNGKDQKKLLKNILSNISVIITLFFLDGCCFPGSETQIIDDGVVLWQGLFPHDFNERDQIERKNSILVSVEQDRTFFGNLETRNKNLNLVFVDPKRKETILWKYVDYGAIEKITFSYKEKVLRIYYDRAIIGVRNKNYVIELDMNTMKKKTVLIKCGEWNL
jgi:hypothetical protein